jgi:hypothetical protein
MPQVKHVSLVLGSVFSGRRVGDDCFIQLESFVLRDHIVDPVLNPVAYRFPMFASFVTVPEKTISCTTANAFFNLCKDVIFFTALQTLKLDNYTVELSKLSAIRLVHRKKTVSDLRIS